MTYELSEAGRVSLSMEQRDYAMLMFLLGIACAELHSQDDYEAYWAGMGFVNELNRTNPAWTPYAIPDEYTPSVRKYKSSGRTA